MTYPIKDSDCETTRLFKAKAVEARLQRMIEESASDPEQYITDYKNRYHFDTETA